MRLTKIGGHVKSGDEISCFYNGWEILSHPSFFPSHGATSGTSIVAIVLGKAAVSFAIDGSTAVFTGEDVFVGLFGLRLIVFDAHFRTGNDTLDMVAVDLIHDLGIALP